MAEILLVVVACLALSGCVSCGDRANDAPAPSSEIQTDSLKCEFRVSPLGVDVPAPRLSWTLRPRDKSIRNLSQTAYRIAVATTADKAAAGMGDLWDSGTIDSDQSQLIAYAGRELASGQQVFWTVTVCDRSGHRSATSATATWTMGIVRDNDWQAKWIGRPDSEVDPAARLAPLSEPTTLLRKTFYVKRGLRRATAFVCGLGQYELSANGSRIGDDRLSPGWTDYRKTCLYDTRDLTPFLRDGSNVVGLFLGGGMYDVRGGRYAKFTGSDGPLQAIAQILIEYDDGTRDIVATDGTWQAAAGPVTFCDVFGGEDYDARLAQRGWDEPAASESEADAKRWRLAVVTGGPGGALRGVTQAAMPIRAFDTFKPVATREIQPRVTVYDFGQNAAVMPRIVVRGPAGSMVRITPAEIVKADGQIDPGAVGSPCYWQYTLAGTPSESWTPTFYYRGARYLEVTCEPAPGGDPATLPSVDSIEAQVIHSDAPAVGAFACSNDLFNRIHLLVRWAQVSNLMSVLTDCPHREKLGWLEQYHLNGPSLRYEWNLATLFGKTLNDMADAQLTNGLVPDIAPEFVTFEHGFRDSPEWGSAIILSAWQQYQFHGDLGVTRRHYNAMTRYVDYLSTTAKSHIIDHGLGDWYDIGPKPPGPAQLTPRALTATAIYLEDLGVLSKMAALLGKDDDAARFAKLATEVRAAYMTKFRDAETGTYATGSQTSNAMTLVLGLCEPGERDGLIDGLIDDIRRRGNATSGGDVGYRYILRALADAGRSDVIVAINNQSEKPGYGYQLKSGATALTEAWDGSHQSSLNHFMLGQINEWFYHDLAGIQPDDAGAGFKTLRIKPAFVEGVAWVRASYESDYGVIRSSWARDEKNGSLTLAVSVPPNTTATIILPAAASDGLGEGGAALTSRTPGVHDIRRDEHIATIKVGSGDYSFTSVKSITTR